MPSDDGLPVDFSSSPREYWTVALERIEERRRELPGASEASELSWKELDYLARMEQLARRSLELAEKETLQNPVS